MTMVMQLPIMLKLLRHTESVIPLRARVHEVMRRGCRQGVACKLHLVLCCRASEVGRAMRTRSIRPHATRARTWPRPPAHATAPCRLPRHRSPTCGAALGWRCPLLRGLLATDNALLQKRVGLRVDVDSSLHRGRRARGHLEGGAPTARPTHRARETPALIAGGDGGGDRAVHWLVGVEGMGDGAVAGVGRHARDTGATVTCERRGVHACRKDDVRRFRKQRIKTSV